MISNHGNDPARSRVTSLGELNSDIAPMRNLWPGIEAAIAGESRTHAQPGASRGGVSRFRSSRSRLLALAAVVSALAVGVWLGRSALPGRDVASPLATTVNQDVLQAAYVTNPAYVQQRAALLASFEAQLRTLPPQTRDKVLASLASIRKSLDDIQAALGHEPGNALLQELLVNTYQDEMRVLTAVHEAGDARKEI